MGGCEGAGARVCAGAGGVAALRGTTGRGVLAASRLAHVMGFTGAGVEAGTWARAGAGGPAGFSEFGGAVFAVTGVGLGSLGFSDSLTSSSAI